MLLASTPAVALGEKESAPQPPTQRTSPSPPSAPVVRLADTQTFGDTTPFVHPGTAHPDLESAKAQFELAVQAATELKREASEAMIWFLLRDEAWIDSTLRLSKWALSCLVPLVLGSVAGYVYDAHWLEVPMLVLFLAMATATFAVGARSFYHIYRSARRTKQLLWSQYQELVSHPQPAEDTQTPTDHTSPESESDDEPSPSGVDVGPSVVIESASFLPTPSSSSSVPTSSSSSLSLSSVPRPSFSTPDAAGSQPIFAPPHARLPTPDAWEQKQAARTPLRQRPTGARVSSNHNKNNNNNRGINRSQWLAQALAE